MAKLYELTKNYFVLWQQLDDMDPEILEAKLQECEGQIEEKAENIAKLIKSIDADVDALKTEEKRLSDRRKALENKKDRVKTYLEKQLEFAGMEKVKTTTFTVAMQNNPASVNIFSEDSIPEQFIMYEKKISKADILEKLKAGEEVPGAILQQSKSLRIR